MLRNVIREKNQSLEIISRTDRFLLHRWDSSMEKADLDKVKEFGKSIYREAGYSDYETKNLDEWSVWFYVTYEGELQAATRIVIKTEENQIPLEIALRHPSGTNYSITNTNVADWNSVTFRQTIIGALSFKIAAKAVAQYCIDRKFGLVYGMINPTWSGLQRVYFDNGAVHSEKYSDLVYYPGCFLRGELALFKLIEIGENALQNIASKL